MLTNITKQKESTTSHQARGDANMNQESRRENKIKYKTKIMVEKGEKLTKNIILFSENRSKEKVPHSLFQLQLPQDDNSKE